MPNTHVRAAAEGMPAISRRRLLNLTGAGLALAASAASVRNASATPPVAAPAEHPDAELFRLDQEMEAAHARMKRMERASSRADRKALKAVGPRPTHPSDWKSPSMPEHLSEMREAALKSVLFVDVVNTDWEPAPVRAWRDAIKQEKAQVRAAWDEYWAKLKDLEHDANEDAFNACVNEVDEFTKRICSIPAHTFEGMAVKLRAHVRSGGEIEKEEMYLDDYAFSSIAADIKRLVGEV
ncbi:hypothetical protein ACN2CC_20820 [Mesorhizobium muleiense]|uniref:hypothetical protein n=1 Tax=Mesorhizobium muleiense TaxID=1004279 RepID=UPI003AFA903E